jgi:hypothetical protein
MPDLAKAALWYAGIGWRVFPCVPCRKQPAVKGWPERATTDERRIAAWWRARPDCNIGVACGAASDLHVLDVDRHDADGEEALRAALGRLGPLPVTIEQRTGSGGRQLFFRYPVGHDCRNTTARIGGGLDTRGEGGFVVVPPSIHPCGRRYRWSRGPHETDLADLPHGWIARLERREDVATAGPIVPPRSVGHAGMLAFVARQVPGNRNAALYWAARKLSEQSRLGIVRWPGDRALIHAAEACGLGQGEAARTIASAKRAGDGAR